MSHSTVTVYSDPVFARHLTGSHPENPRRTSRIADHLAGIGRLTECHEGDCIPATDEQLLAVHDPSVLARARATCLAGGGMLDNDTVVSPESFDVAKAAAGACVAAVDEVVKGRSRRALSLIRPPGHHATPSHSMGFCLFNNVAVAARWARDEHGLTRLMIVDWDVHHGNGTQDVFWSSGDADFLSMHRYGHGFYPGTGAHDETGTGAGQGRIRNLPIRFGTSRKEILSAFRTAAEEMADRVRPELILISAGFDAHALDPIGSLGLEVEDFATMTRTLLDIAETHCGGRVVSCLEGGYNLDVLPLCVDAHLVELLK